MKTDLSTFAFAVGFAAVFINCIAWLGLWGQVSPVKCLFVWALWCGPALGMMAVSDLRYRRLITKLRADAGKSPLGKTKLETRSSQHSRRITMDEQNEKESGATDGLPLAAGVSGSEKRRGRCLCDICVRISPMHTRLREALPEPLRADLEYLMMRLMCAEEDRDVAEAKMYGNWPGWEWMKAAREKEEAASPNGGSEPPLTARKGNE